MLKRISTSLFSPKYLAHFLFDKIWFVLLYFIIFCALSVVPTAVSLSSASLIDGSEYEKVEARLFETEETVTINNYKLEVSNAFYFTSDAYVYSFKAGSISTTNIVFYFGENKLSIVEFGIIIAEKTYEELGVSSFSIDKDSLVSTTAFLLDMVKDTCSSHTASLITVMVVYVFFKSFFTYLFIGLIMYFIAAFINPNVKGKLRLRMVTYALTPLFVFDILANTFSFGLFHYIGVIYSVVVLYLSLKVIVRIEVKKK